MGISVSNVERDRAQLHQALGVQGRVTFTIDVFSLAGTGRDLGQEHGIFFGRRLTWGRMMYCSKRDLLEFWERGSRKLFRRGRPRGG